MTGCPYGGGALPVWMRPTGSHTPRIPSQYTARCRCTGTKIHAAPCLLFTCETSVCLQIAKRAYLRAFRVIYKYIYIVTRKAKKIHKFCHPPHVRRLGRLKNTRPPQHCHDAARTEARRQNARGHTARSRPDAAKAAAQNGAI